MKFKLVITAVFAVAAMLVAGALALDLGSKGSGESTAQSPGTVVPTQNQSPATATSAAPSGKAKSQQGSPEGAAKQSEPRKSRGTDKPKGSGMGSDQRKAPASPTRALEMPEKRTPTSHKLPKSKVRVPAVSSMPKPGESRGKLVAGFPKKAVNLPPKASIVSSSVASQAKRLLVQLDARTKSSEKSVLAFYAADFAKKGWITTSGTAADGSRTMRGAFAQDSAVVTVHELPTGQTGFSISGAFIVDE